MDNMIAWVKYGFESTPLKMYNLNVSSAIFLSFLKATCIKDIDDFCKQKNIQLSIELDAIRRATAVGRKASVVPAAESSAADTTAGSRPSSGNTSDGQRPTTPSALGIMRRASSLGAPAETLTDEEESTRAKKLQLEKQLDTINEAAKLVKELIAGIAWIDLVDANGTRMNLDSAGNERAQSLLTARQQYSAVAVSKTENGDTTVTSLVFKLAS